ncbi:hypothetical protein MKW92_018552 [Papaver armeniacum]|nr:hypothetical protein MKW92_018552 [Papaver armeniacum]
MAEPAAGSEESENISVVVVSENTESALGTTNSGKQGSSTKKKTTWWSPKVLLLIFCLMNLLNYVDRGVIASTGVNGTPKVCNESGECIDGKGIQGAFNLTNFQDGALSTAFMVGLLVASPIFASLAKRYNKPFRLIGVGLLIWTIATACCGVTSSFWNIAVCRMLVGVGEASFMSLAETFCLGLFYMCIPVGIAFGYVYGGFVASHLNWRCAFFGEAILMLPFVLLCFFMEPLQLKVLNLLQEVKITEVSEHGKDVLDISSGEGQSNNKTSRKRYLSKRTIKQLSKRTIKRISRFAKTCLERHESSFCLKRSYTFVIGAYSFWGPKAGADIYHMTNPDIFFGGITIVCGICGTLAGAYLLMHKLLNPRTGLSFLLQQQLLEAHAVLVPFVSKHVWFHRGFSYWASCFLFGAQAPSELYLSSLSVKPSLRPISLAISTVAIHIFGDVPSSPLVGRLQDQIHNWRTTTLILTSIFGVAAAIWLIGVFLDSVDRYNEEDNASTNTEPVAAENTVENFDEHSEI